MSQSPSISQTAAAPSVRVQTLVLTLSVGVAVLPLFAAQPLVGLIGPDLGISDAFAGLAPMMTLLGYASGLLLLVPLTDLLENRKVIVRTLGLGVVAAAGVAVASTPVLTFAALFAVGATTSAIHMMVPVAAAMTPEATRGRTIGTIMSGLMIGILMSRPCASLAARLFGWRDSFVLDAALLFVTALVLRFILPRRQPIAGPSYGRLIASLGEFLRDEPVLRRRAAYQTLCMGSFSVFWTAVAFRLSAPPFDLGQIGLAIFALAGVGGAIIAPVAGRLGDRGYTRPVTRLAHLTVIVAQLLAGMFGTGWLGFDPAAHPALAIGVLACAALLLDIGVIADQTLGRRLVNLLRPEARGRMNGLFTGLFFLGASTGSALSGIVWSSWGWSGVCLAGAAYGAAALALTCTDRSTVSQADA